MKAIALILGVAVSASAAVVSHVWKLGDDGAGLFAVVLTTGDEGITLRAGGTVSRFTSARLTQEEAASLGRALLEAAGDKGLPCPCRPSNIYDDYVYCPKEAK